MGWKDVLKENQTDWLLEADNPSVRYFTLRDIVGLAEDAHEVTEAKSAIMGSDIVKAILKTQKTEGYWGSETDLYLPKYSATTHQLLILAEHSASRTHEIEKAIEHVYRFQRNSGHFLTQLPKTERGKNSIVKDGCCYDGNILHYLSFISVT